jgi:hypothetical protein
MSFVIKKASKQAKKLRIGVSAPSGAGKTYGALLIAYGICGDWSKICVIDSERESASLYSDLGEYNTINLEAPYSPKRYCEAIKAAEDAGMEVIIADSTSHEWNGPGGCLEIHAQMGGKFQDWKVVTPMHNNFIDTILRSKSHVICTIRKKQGYEIGQGGSGMKVQKLGLEDIQRDGFEYELDLVLNIDAASHMASVSKDRTNLFSGKPDFVITKDTGDQLKSWAANGRNPLDDAMDLVRATNSVEELSDVWSNYTSLQTNEDFVAALKNRKEQLKVIA